MFVRSAHPARPWPRPAWSFLKPLVFQELRSLFHEILAVGNGKVGDDGKVRPLGVKVGDKVLFGKYSGQTVKVEGDELLVMREEDIMAVVEG